MLRFFVRALFLAALGFQSVSTHPSAKRAVHVVPHGLEIVDAVIALHQNRIAEAEDLLTRISDPDSEQFGHYLDHEGLEELFSPSEAAHRKVLEWLASADISQESTRLRKASAVIQFRATIDQMRTLLKTDHRIVQNPQTGEHKLETANYVIPPELEETVQFVRWALPSDTLSPRMPIGRKRSVADAVLSASPKPTPFNLTDCNLSWTPECIRKYYRIPLGKKAAKNNSIGIFGFGDAYNQENLNNFWTKYVKFIPNDTAPVVNSINGAKAPGPELDGEQLLDIQMAWPIAWPQNLTIFQTPYNDLGGIADDFLDAVDASYCKYMGGDSKKYDLSYPAFQGYPGPAMCGTYNVTNVISISFAPDESKLSAFYVQRQCSEWMKLALRGVTVVVASGDRGVTGNFGCAKGPGNTYTKFNPLFPGTCPYVTTVGASQVNFTGDDHQEVAVYDPKHNYYSGGGFSNFNARPAYQDQAVKAYLAAHDPKYPTWQFNRTGRAFPDVAVMGANLTISDDGQIVVSGGTSAATPLFAGMISRINDERLLAGKRPIGFLNQILYKHPEVFTDRPTGLFQIVQGSNPGCNTTGFQAAKGWDPVSGLGVPVFPKLRKLLVGLP